MKTKEPRPKRALSLPSKTVLIPDRTYMFSMTAKLPRIAITMPAFPWETTDANKDTNHADD